MAHGGLRPRAKVECIVDHFGDFRWRLHNLYWITTKEGNKVKFEPNWAQAAFLENMHHMNCILKARQLGFTTFIQIFMLDQIVFNSNVNAGTIAHNLGDAMSIFQSKIKFPYDSLPEGVRLLRKPLRDSRTELALSNGSSIRVGVSMRSGTLHYLHISEYGKLCAKFPDKAREVRTGALNTVQAGQWVTVESTAEGQEGGFYDMCETARSLERCGSPLTVLDMKFHFFPWWKEPAYRLPAEGLICSPGMLQYFDDLRRLHGIALDDEQRAWYIKKAAGQLGDMKREYPSTADEAFAASVEGAYYGAWIEAAESQGRIGSYPADPAYPVLTAWDLGVGDSTAIWFFQILPGEVRIVGYFESSGEGLPFYTQLVKTWYKTYGWHRERAVDIVPHDARVREWGTKKTRVEQMIEAGFHPRIPAAMSVDDGINAVRTLLMICTFDAARTVEGVKMLKAYRKEWNSDTGCWLDTPLHNYASHGADAFRYLAAGHREVSPPPPKSAQVPVDSMTFNQLIEREEAFEERQRVFR